MCVSKWSFETTWNNHGHSRASYRQLYSCDNQPAFDTSESSHPENSSLPRSKPDLCQPVLLVITLAMTRARCHGTQTCGTLCSFLVLRTDHPHIPFAAQPLTDGTSLIPRDALLDAIEDDDDIEWLENPFNRPHRAEPESPWFNARVRQRCSKHCVGNS